MNPGEESRTPEQVRDAYESKARAELAAAEALAPGSDCVPWSGAVIADVALVKGMPGPAEVSGGPALSGPDGDAIAKALLALGWSAECAFATLSRPEPEVPEEQRIARLRLQIEAVDPQVVIALDSVAAEDLAAAYQMARPLKPGVESVAKGRRLLAVDGFEASLGDEARKRRIWSQMRPARPSGPVF